MAATDRPAVSIVIPTFNSGSYLADTIESVRAQTVQDWALVLVDDGSTDGTAERAEQWAAGDTRLRVVRGDHRGPNAARNKGLTLCDPSSWAITFLDHDDVWEPDALEVLMAALAGHADAAAAYGLAYYIDAKGARYDAGLEAWTRNRLAVSGRKIAALPAGAATTFSVLAIGNRIPTPGQVLVRRSALERAGAWNLESEAAADYELWLRLSLLSALVFVDRPVIGWRQHQSNFSKHRPVIEQSNLNVRRRYAFDPTLPFEVRNALLVGYRYTQSERMRQRFAWAKGSLLRGDVVNAVKQCRHAILDYFRYLQGLRPFGQGFS